MKEKKTQPIAQGGDLPSPPTYYNGLEPIPTKPKKKRRVFMWFFLAVQVLFIVWLIAGVSGAGSTPADTGGVLTQEEANSARDAGTAIGVGLVLILWAIVDFLLAVVWAVVKLARR